MACENMGAQMVREVASKTSDGRRRRHHHCHITRRGDLPGRFEICHCGGEPDWHSARHPEGGGRSRRNLARITKKVKDKEEIKQVATSRPTGT